MPKTPFIAEYSSVQPHTYTIIDSENNHHSLNLNQGDIVLVERINSLMQYGVKNSIDNSLEYVSANSFTKEITLPNFNNIINIRDKSSIMKRYTSDPNTSKRLDTLLEVHQVELYNNSCIVEFLKVTDPHGDKYRLVRVKDIMIFP